MGFSQDDNLDGTPCAMKVACTVWVGGKVRDNIKCLPIDIVNPPDAAAAEGRLWGQRRARLVLL